MPDDLKQDRFTNNEVPEEREREVLAFGRLVDWRHEADFGVVRFEPDSEAPFPGLRLHEVRKLCENGFLKPELAHDSSAPPASEFIDFGEYVKSEYQDYQLEVVFVGYMPTRKRREDSVRLRGLVIRSPGEIPDQLQLDVSDRFQPEVLEVDRYQIRVVWD